MGRTGTVINEHTRVTKRNLHLIRESSLRLLHQRRPPTTHLSCQSSLRLLHQRRPWPSSTVRRVFHSRTRSHFFSSPLSCLALQQSTRELESLLTRSKTLC